MKQFNVTAKFYYSLANVLDKIGENYTCLERYLKASAYFSN